MLADMLARVLLLVGVAACGSSQRSTLSKAGDDRDDGAGILAQASIRLITNDETTEIEVFTERRARTPYSAVYGGSMYGGDPYGGAAYGGATYAGWTVPQWNYAPPNRVPSYNIVGGLSGSVEGTVTWTGAPPAKVTSACGPIANPTLRVGTDKAARGVIVYIEKVAVGRATPYYARPAGVGGVLSKRGCALVPAAQIVAPLPSSLSIHGDDTRAKLRVSAPPVGGKPRNSTHDLQEGGLVQLEVKSGVMRVDSDDDMVAAAWVLGLETPYFAITDDAGRYRIDELAPGTYELTFWQPPVATASPDGTFSYGAPIVVRRSVKVGGKASQLSVALPGR